MPLIVIEGIDGTGKTTLQHQLVGHYEGIIQLPTLAVKFPGDEHTPICLTIRSILFNPHLRKSKQAELFLFAADMANTIEKTIKPALERDVLVIADRWAHSMIAYQNTRNTLPTTNIQDIATIATRDVIPDGVIYLHPPEPDDGEWVKTCYQRAQDGNQYEAAGIEFQRQVSDWYRTLALKEKSPYAEINPTRDPHTAWSIAVRFINDVLDGNTIPHTNPNP